MGVYQTEAIILAEVQRAAVPVFRAVPGPGWVGRIGLSGGVSEDLLHIPVAQFGIGLQHQGGDPADDRCGKGSARGGDVVPCRVTCVAHTVGRHDVLPRSRYEDRCSRGTEGGDVPIFIGCRHGDDETAVLVIVIVGVLSILATVSRREYDDAA